MKETEDISNALYVDGIMNLKNKYISKDQIIKFMDKHFGINLWELKCHDISCDKNLKCKDIDKLIISFSDTIQKEFEKLNNL